jgi:hypothetical protein
VVDELSLHKEQSSNTMKSSSQRKLNVSLQLFLRIKHPSLDPLKISVALGIEPEHTMRAGESVSAAGRRTLHSESYWIAQLPTTALPMTIAAEILQDYKALASTASAEEKTLLQQKLFTRNAYPLQGLTKDDMLELIGASPIELLIVPWLRKLAVQGQFFTQINADGGSATLVVQLRNVEYPLRIRPALARRLAITGMELELNWGV